MFTSAFRLVTVHSLLAIASAVVFWSQHGEFLRHGHLPRRAIAPLVVLETLMIWIPYIFSGLYSCSLLPSLPAAATTLFILYAAGVGIVANAWCLHVLGLSSPPIGLLLLCVTLLLLLGSWVCARAWRRAAAGWSGR